MDDHTALPMQPHSSLSQVSRSAPISNESLNELLRLIESQKNSGFSEVNTPGFTGRSMTPSISVLDSAGFQLEERTPQIRVNTPSCTPSMRPQPPPGINLNTPQLAYNADALSSVGQLDAYTQVSTGSTSH